MAIFFSLSQPAGLWKELKESFVFWATEITDTKITCSEKKTQTIQVYILLFSEPASMLQILFIWSNKHQNILKVALLKDVSNLLEAQQVCAKVPQKESQRITEL